VGNIASTWLSKPFTAWGYKEASFMLINLHTHLEGTVRPGTAAELAESMNVPTPPGGWENAFRIKKKGDLTIFLAHVAMAYPLLGNAENLRRVAFEAVEDAAKDGQSYIELRLGPATHARKDLSIRQVLEAVCRGVEEAKVHTGIRAGVIACMLRHEPDEIIAEITHAAIALAGSGIVGIDIAGDEILYPSLARYAPLYDLARAAGLGLTAHAAEAGPASAGKEAVELLGVTRIGHGSNVASDPEMLEWVRAKGVTIEVCPTSNVLTGAAPSLKEHPVVDFVKAGVKVALGDDDPENTGVRLSQEAFLLVSEGGLLAEDIRKFAYDGISAAFCSQEIRAELMVEWGQE
ncbi:MAG: adenosine deaminase, partial [Actinobacteria bacterium]|nr:adenosine deaminase [Actinomycetota bacterium]